MKILLILSFILTTVTLSVAQQKNDTIKGTHQTAKQLTKKVRNDKAYLVDVRTPEEYKAGHLKYSKNIDYKSNDFKNEISKLDKNKAVYLYCRSGNRSSKAADTLKALGYKVYFNIGGFEDLKLSGMQEE